MLLPTTHSRGEDRLKMSHFGMREDRSSRDPMKLAQYEVLGNDAKGDIRPAIRDDRNDRLLISHAPLQAKAAVDRPVRGASLFLNANPSTSYWANFVRALRDYNSDPV